MSAEEDAAVDLADVVVPELRAGIERRENSQKRVRKSRCEVEDVVVAVAATFVDGRRMPADQRRFYVVLDIQIRERLCRLWNFAEISAEITARMGIESACARMDVNVNGAHGLSPVPCMPTAKDSAGRSCRKFDVLPTSR